VSDYWAIWPNQLEAQSIAGLRLRLALQPPTVASLPWESLYDPERHEMFGANGQTPLVRIENLFQHVRTPHTLHAELPIRILLAVPDDPSGQINGAHEIEQLQAIFTQFGSQNVQLSILQGQFNVIDLRNKIEQEQAQIVHLITHGKPEGILLWQRGKPTWATPDALHTALQRTHSVRLVFLNACLAGSSSQQAPFTTVGPQLLQIGIPAVLAMQFEIPDEDAREFASYVYEELLGGRYPGAIDAAVGYARSNLYALNPASFSYGVPVLWLNAEDGLIFSLPRGQRLKAQSQSEPQPEVVPEYDVTAIESWVEEVQQFDSQQLPADLRFLWADWSMWLNNLNGALHQLRTLQEQSNVSSDVYKRKIAEIEELREQLKRIEPTIRQHLRST